MNTLFFLVLTLLVALEAYGLRRCGEHVLILAGVDRVTFHTLFLSVRLVNTLSGLPVLLVTGDAEIIGRILQHYLGRRIHLVAGLALAIGHRFVKDVLQKSGTIGTVGRVAQHTPGLYRITSVCCYKDFCTCLVTGKAGLILPLQEQSRVVRGMIVVTCLTACFHRRMNVRFHDGLSIVTGETGILPFRLEETREGPVVNLVAFIAPALSHGFVDRRFFHAGCEFLVTRKAEIRLVLAKISPPDETMGQVTGPAVFLFYRGMHNPGKELLTQFLVTFQTLFPRLSLSMLGYAGCRQGKAQKHHNKPSSFSCHFSPPYSFLSFFQAFSFISISDLARSCST